MELFCKTFLYFTTSVLLTSIFQLDQINCFSLNTESNGAHIEGNIPLKTACPGNRVYINSTGKCYRERSKGPCGMRMVVSSLLSDPNLGECVCESVCLGRPMVPVWEQNRCYFIFEQGPCSSGQWLVPREDDVPICETIPCPERYNISGKPSTFDGRFLFSYEGQCYMTGVRGEGPCQAHEKAYIFTVKHECTEDSIACGGLGNVQEPNDCQDGLAPDAFGGCEPSTIL